MLVPTLLVALTVLISSCGGGEVVPGVLERPVESSASTTPSTLTTPGDFRLPGLTDGEGVSAGGPEIEAEPWVDLTANLVGLDSTCGSLSFVSAHPSTDGVYANVATQGLFSLSEDGSEWSLVGSNINHRTQWIEYDDDDPDRFWVSGAYGTGVYRTDNGGDSFRQLGSLSHIDGVAVDTSDEGRQVLLAGVHEAKQIMRSVNGGQTWTEISQNLPGEVGFTTAPLFVGSGFLIGTYSGDESGIYRTEDGGETWTQVFDQPIYGNPVVTDDYIAWNLDSGSGGMTVSRDGGETFTAGTARPGGRSYTLVDLGDGVLAATSRSGVAITSDFGDSWQPVGEPLPFEPIGVAYSAARSRFFAWTASCFADDADNAIGPETIMELSVDLTEQ